MRCRAKIMLISTLLLASPVAAQDSREPTSRTPAERTFILGQMRLFLSSIQAISTGLAAGDMSLVVAEASARGRRGTPVSAIPPEMKAKETPAWGTMMSGARGGFDKMAEAAASGATSQQLIGQLGETMRTCVACHQSYRLVEE